ncbi:hypothetical protein [Marinimicrobium sp. C2-29]|uniref:hypothetical protein n=1 Tax=Marinimicrobium sp. C2-29 TaxID=3139825 RepID=UPI0031392372
MQPEKLLQLAHFGMLASVVLTLGAVALGYWFYQGLSLTLQIAAHFSLIPFATVLKISYITRLVALKQLGRPVN